MRLAEKEERLIGAIEKLGSVIVAYSGGVDSSLVAYYARNLLSGNARVVIAVSPSLAEDDLIAARAQALKFNWDLTEIKTKEFDQVEYQKNDQMRCYFCKSALFEELAEFAGKEGIRRIVYGANLDDSFDYRPGALAARERDICAPLVEAELTKVEIRELARNAGLPSWDRPQNACLSSRVVTGIPVTVETLSRVEAAERYVRSLGFKVLRVRHHGEKAVVEVGAEEIGRFDEAPNLVQLIRSHLSALGYSEVTIDPRGYRRGSAVKPGEAVAVGSAVNAVLTIHEDKAAPASVPPAEEVGA